MTNTRHLAWIGALILTLASVPSISAAADPDMTFELAGTGGNCAGCGWIQATGLITDQSSERLEELARKWNGLGRQTILFDSPGGNLIGALRLGRTIRALGLNTGVGESVSDGYGWQKQSKGECLSACAFAFLGGEERSAGPGEVGLHQFYDPTAILEPQKPVFTALDVSANQLLEGLLLDYVLEMGVDSAVVSLAAATPPTEMHLVTGDELRRLRISWEPDRYSDWKIEAYKTGLIAFAKSDDGRKTVSIFCIRGHKKVLLSETNSSTLPPLIQLDSFDELFPIDVFGRHVARDQATLTRHDDSYSVSFDLGDQFAIPADRRKVAISNTDTPRAYWFFVDLSESTGLAQNAKLAFKNCIE